MIGDQLDNAAVEKAIISLIIQKPFLYTTASLNLDATCFNEPSWKMVWEVCTKLHSKEMEWTWQSLADIVIKVEGRTLILEKPLALFGELISYAPDDEQLDFFVTILSNRSVKEKLTISLTKLSQDIVDPSITLEELYDNLRGMEDHFSSASFGKTRNVGPHNLGVEIKKDLVEIANTPFIGTMYERIDQHLTWGFAPGQISVIAGRPTMGKSTFRSNIQRLLSDNKIHTITISKEQSIIDEYLRLISMQTGMSVRDIVLGIRGKNSSFNQDSFLAALKKMSGDWPHRIIKPNGLFFLRDIKRVVRDCRKEGEDPKIVFIDLFTQLDDISVASDAGRKAGIISQKLLQLASMAEDLQVHMCAVVQLKRVGKDGNKIDRQELYKESGSYEERADLMFQVSRPAYYKPDEIEDNTIEVYIGKQRQGVRSKVIPLLFDAKSLRIDDKQPELLENDEEYNENSTF